MSRYDDSVYSLLINCVGAVLKSPIIVLFHNKISSFLHENTVRETSDFIRLQTTSSLFSLRLQNEDLVNNISFINMHNIYFFI